MKQLRPSIYFIAIIMLIISTNVTAVEQTAKQQANKNTVGLISGGVGGTYARFAQDLSNVLDEENELRVIPVLGKGSLQNIADLLWLKGIDIAIVQSDALSAAADADLDSDIKNKIAYIAKLYNEEVHLVANKKLTSLKELSGKKVSLGGKGSGTSMTASLIFNSLDIPIEVVNMANEEALAAVISGEISAAVFVAGKPASFLEKELKTTNIHLLPIELPKDLFELGYVDSKFNSIDYPNLIDGEKTIETVAVGALMAVYNWPEDSNRFNRITAFVNKLSDNLKKLQSSDAYHPKWKQVDFKNTVPGWERFPAPGKKSSTN